MAKIQALFASRRIRFTIKLMKKILLVIGAIIILLLGGFAALWYYRTTHPFISFPQENIILRESPVWEIEGITKEEYEARFSATIGLPTFTSVSTETVKYFLNEDLSVATGYLAMPEGDGPFPSIIMIHEWWGLNDQVKNMARQYAGQGYAVFAVDLYGGGVATTPQEAKQLATSVGEFKTEAFSNLEAALRYMTDKPEVDATRVASLGWCFGGGWSYEMAKNNLGTKASVIYYGRFNPKDDLSIMSANIQGHFGAEDQSIPVDDVKAFQAKLATLNGEHQVFIYENAGHAFANEESDAYQQESAEQAWERTLEFLKANL